MAEYGRSHFILNTKLWVHWFLQGDVNTYGAKRAGHLREEMGEEIGED